MGAGRNSGGNPREFDQKASSPSFERCQNTNYPNHLRPLRRTLLSCRPKITYVRMLNLPAQHLGPPAAILSGAPPFARYLDTPIALENLPAQPYRLDRALDRFRLTK